MNDALAKARAKLQHELLNIEARTDLTDSQKTDQIITVFATACAAIAVQPIPFADFFILTPLQGFMGARIAAVRGVPISEAQSVDLLKELMGVVGMGLIAQQAGIAAAKVFFPLVGGIATVPVVFGLTFAIGKVMDFYLEGKAAGRIPTASELKAAWANAKAVGDKEGQRRQHGIAGAGSTRDISPDRTIAGKGRHVANPKQSSSAFIAKTLRVMLLVILVSFGAMAAIPWLIVEYLQ